MRDLFVAFVTAIGITVIFLILQIAHLEKRVQQLEKAARGDKP